MRSFLGRLTLPLICILLGAGIYFFGRLGVVDKPSCGGQLLAVGEKCAHMTKDGDISYTTYDQELSDANRVHVYVQNTGYAVAGIGVLAGLWTLVTANGRARRDDDAGGGEPPPGRMQITNEP